jgi:gas vesicle protein
LGHFASEPIPDRNKRRSAAMGYIWQGEEKLMTDENNEYASQGDYRSSEKNVSLGLTMLFIGLAVGALTALLLAPKTGRQMRKSLRRKYEDARDVMEDLGDQASDWVDRGSDWAEKAKQRVAPFAKQFRR